MTNHSTHNFNTGDVPHVETHGQCQQLKDLLYSLSRYFRTNAESSWGRPMCLPLFLGEHAGSPLPNSRFENLNCIHVETHGRASLLLRNARMFLFLLIAISSMSLYSEDENKNLFSNPVVSDESMTQFKKIAEKLQENKIVRADFKQTKSIKALKRPLLSEGVFLISQAKGLYFETLKPYEQLTVITPEYLIQKDSGGNVSKLKSDSHPLLQKSTESFLSIFSGKTESLKEQYKIYILIEGENWQIGLTPKDNNESKEYIGRIVFKGSKYLNSLYMEEKLGNTTVIEYTNHKTDQSELSSEEIKKFELKK